jgi:hypothetical protein
MPDPIGDHYLRVDVTQGVDGPARPPVRFPAGTRVRLVAGLGGLIYVEARHPDLTDGTATLVVRSEEVAAVPYLGPMSTRYPACTPTGETVGYVIDEAAVLDCREESDHGTDDAPAYTGPEG